MSAGIRNVAWGPPPEDENACPGAYPRWVPGRVWIVRTEAGANLSSVVKAAYPSRFAWMLRRLQEPRPGCTQGAEPAWTWLPDNTCRNPAVPNGRIFSIL